MGKIDGTYRLKNWFYGLNSMPAEFQKVIDTLLKEFPQANAFINDMLVVSKKTEPDGHPKTEGHPRTGTQNLRSNFLTR